MRWTPILLALFIPVSVTCFSSPPDDKQTNKITHGPILGRLGAHQIGVWARTNRPGKFHVIYGTTSDKLDKKSPSATTALNRDNTGWVLLKGLKANTTYHYKLVIGDKTANGGSFKTMPDAKDYRDAKFNPKGLYNFSFEYACGNNQNEGHSIGPALPTFKTMMKNLHGKINFAILNGDWLYENSRMHTVKAWQKQTGTADADVPQEVKVAPTLVGVWQNYKVFLDQGKNLSTWHRNMPSFFTMDDHEILNDVWGAGEPGITERRAVFRDMGVKAWYDYLAWSNPTEFKQGVSFGKAKLEKGNDILVDPNADFTKLDLKQVSTLLVHWNTKDAGVNENALDELKPGEPNAGVYGIKKILGKNKLQIYPTPKHTSTCSYSIGRRSYYKMSISNCDFFFLDTRTHREMHDLEDRNKKGISMIGREQKAWLMKEMEKSKADFLFVVSSVNFMVPHVGGGKVRPQNKDDAWTVFLEEREQLLKFWDKRKQPVFILTGDLHNSFAIKITDNVYEFASGPHNSNNHVASDEGDRPANGEFDSFGKKCHILWSTYFPNDVPRDQLQHPNYCVVQVNNVFNAPKKVGEERWVAFPIPQVIFRYYDGRTGNLRYAHSVAAR